MVGPVGAGDPRLADWGDSCITHPFSSLFVPYDVALNRMTYDDMRGAALRLRDAYLDAWSSHGSMADLRRIFAPCSMDGAPYTRDGLRPHADGVHGRNGYGVAR